jgi:hypothetical protein
VSDVTSTVTPVPSPTLTAADRCDRCGAQAYVRALLVSGELLFCAHHAKQHEDKVRPVALEWTDETATIPA